MANGQAKSRMQSYIPKPKGSLCEATAELIAACGGLSRAAELCRVSTTLSGYANPENRANIPVDVALSLEKGCGLSPVSKWIVAMHGACMMGSSGPVHFDWRRYIADVSQDFARAVASPTKALTDSHIDSGKAIRISNDLAGLIEQARQMRQALAARVSQPSSLVPAEQGSMS